MSYQQTSVALAFITMVSLPACSEVDGPVGPPDTEGTRFDLTASSIGLVTFSFDGSITRVDATPPTPFQGTQQCDPWTLSYTFDPSGAFDVDPSPTAGQYRDLVTTMTLGIRAVSVTGTPSLAVPNDLASGIFTNLGLDAYADYAAVTGLPDPSGWVQVNLRDDTGTPFDSDALPVVLPGPLEIAFPTARDFFFRKPQSTSLFLRGTVGRSPDCPVVDIKPGGDPNSINCSNPGEIISVAVLTTDDFDATTLDHTTVIFEGAREVHIDPMTGNPRRHEDDVDEDGDIDLIFHFRLDDTDLTCDSTDGRLSGETYGGQAIGGTDAISMRIAGKSQ